MVASLKFIALAAIQGLAEFLPISSSGHLALAEMLFGIESPGPSLELFLHLGTVFSVCIFYRKRLAQLATAFLRLEKDAVRYAAYVCVSAVPAALVHFCAKDRIADVFDAPRAIGCLLVANGALLLLSCVTDALQRGRGGGISLLRALAMGVGQGIAIFPGISRSGTSIHAGRIAGMSPGKAAEFSFIMSLPAILGAILLELRSNPAGLTAGMCVSEAAIATLVSGAVGCFALKVVVKTLEKGRFWVFGVWCIAAGALAVSLA